MSEIVRPAEIEASQEWLRGAFFEPGGGPGHAGFPVSFLLDGSEFADRSATGSSANWLVARAPSRSERGATLNVVTWSEARTGLECRCEIRGFDGFPAVEWVAHIRNTGDSDSPILSEIRPLDVLFQAGEQTACTVHHARGALSQLDDFAPLETPLTFRQGGSSLDMSAGTGKPSTLNLPFFNLELGAGGVIGAIGWTGGWSASFQRVGEGVRVRTGMERTHLRLHPGEEIRTPRILLLFWDADRTRAQNMFRRLMLAHYTPHPNGRELRPPFCDAAWGALSEASHLANIGWLREHQIPVECYWIDAGWYGDQPIEAAADPLKSDWGRQVGSWIPNRSAFPQGLRPVAEAAEAAGLGFLLWIEPERAFRGTQMVREHPQWLLGPVASGNLGGFNYMVNLGNPDARRAVTDLVSRLIDEYGITCYRQDFNDLKVPELYAGADVTDRIGMTEIRHVEGLYAFWDELRARHPGLIIDNCAGGGQRIDLETMARSVPLWRSDLQCWPFDPMAMQTQTQGLAPWVPLSAGVCDEPTEYALRSALGPGMVTHWSSQVLETGADFPASVIRGLMAEASAVRQYFYGDFYPLLAFSLAPDSWAAWQYDLPKLGEGILVAFRRHGSPFSSMRARLRALEPAADYEIYSWDDRAARRIAGAALMTQGLEIIITDTPGSQLLVYKRLMSTTSRGDE